MLPLSCRCNDALLFARHFGKVFCLQSCRCPLQLETTLTLHSRLLGACLLVGSLAAVSTLSLLPSCCNCDDLIHAGLVCPIIVTFTPQLNEDIEEHINVLAHTGPIQIPLICRSRKATPVISNATVEIGNVTMGETGTASIIIQNKVRV